jgi:hypothetical protein
LIETEADAEVEVEAHVEAEAEVEVGDCASVKVSTACLQLSKCSWCSETVGCKDKGCFGFLIETDAEEQVEEQAQDAAMYCPGHGDSLSCQQDRACSWCSETIGCKERGCYGFLIETDAEEQVEEQAQDAAMYCPGHGDSLSCQQDRACSWCSETIGCKERGCYGFLETDAESSPELLETEADAELDLEVEGQIAEQASSSEMSEAEDQAFVETDAERAVCEAIHDPVGCLSSKCFWCGTFCDSLPPNCNTGL